MSARLLTARMLAERLDVTPATVLRWARRGDLPAIRLPSGAIRFREEQVECRLDEWTRAHPAPAGVVSALPTLTHEEA